MREAPTTGHHPKTDFTSKIPKLWSLRTINIEHVFIYQAKCNMLEMLALRNRIRRWIFQVLAQLHVETFRIRTIFQEYQQRS